MDSNPLIHLILPWNKLIGPVRNTINLSYRELTFSNYLVPGWDGGQNDVFLAEFKKLMPSSYDILQGGAVLHMITLG